MDPAHRSNWTKLLVICLCAAGLVALGAAGIVALAVAGGNMLAQGHTSQAEPAAQPAEASDQAQTAAETVERGTWPMEGTAAGKATTGRRQIWPLSSAVHVVATVAQRTRLTADTAAGRQLRIMARARPKQRLPPRTGSQCRA